MTTEYQLCPNTTQFFVKNGFTSDTQLILNIYMSDEALLYDGTHFIASSDITRFFNAEDYNDNGYMTAVQTSQ